ncbi:P-loop containing nucleoside triphosphate hydrolase protein [Mycena vulgaris]|nr:P-loop containing nucleoside triphosphate hydrolase protein [Mycena vulgaris]
MFSAIPNLLISPLTVLFPSMLGALGSHSSIVASLKLIVLGSLIEAARRLFGWAVDRFRLQYSITAIFYEGDPAYDWMMALLLDQSLSRGSHQFLVSATGSQRKWSVQAAPTAAPTARGHAEYVPNYTRPRLTNWNGHWFEVKQNDLTRPGPFEYKHISLTLYTLSMDMRILEALVEHARTRYLAVAREKVVIRQADMTHGTPWGSVKHKVKRRLDTIVLPEGVMASILDDAREFIDAEPWYLDNGIPHRRGYLLQGPPGTGKTSTIYALAGELGLEIYSISLASAFVDDAYLQRAVSCVPKKAILLIEDIDCCFLRGDDADPLRVPLHPCEEDDSKPRTRRSGPAVTLSGLLNVIDGVSSDDGRLFFATTNHPERLDPALVRPGRVDMVVQYNLAIQDQIRALFVRLYPPERFPDTKVQLDELAGAFADAVPAGQFSIADLQGHLLGFKAQPENAVRCVGSLSAPRPKYPVMREAQNEIDSEAL